MATSASESHLLFLDTRTSIRPSTPYDTQFNLNNAISANLDDYRMSIQSAEVPNLVYPVNRFNDQVYFTENGGGVITTALTQKNYDGTELARVLALVMTNATGVAETYTGTYDIYTKKITISAAGATSITFENGANNSDFVTGFSNFGEILIGGGDASRVVRLDGTEYIDILTNLNTQNYSSNGNSNILFRIPMNVGFGSVVFQANNTDDHIFVSSNSMNTFSILIRDSNGRPFELPDNAHVSFIFKLEAIY